MWIPLLEVLIGLFVLSWAADQFVTGAAALARHLGVSSLLIGLTIVAFGTSMPEIFVAVTAGLKGASGLAVGNAIGSNIANIALVLGMTAIIAPIMVDSSIVRREYPILFLVMFLVLALFFDRHFSRVDAIILLVGLVCFTAYLVRMGIKQGKQDVLEEEFEHQHFEKTSKRKATFLLVLGLILLPLSSRVLVVGATDLATIFGISDLIIGLTIVAIGTSLPEVAVSIAGAVKGEPDISVGNIVGSNIFNMLAVLPAAGIIHEAELSPEILWRDMSVMFLVTVMLYVMSIFWGGRGNVTRYEGAVLLTTYIAYLGWLGFTAL